MIIDEFEYWEKLPQGFSDLWFKTLCHKVKIYEYELEYSNVIYKDSFIYENSIDI